MNEPLQIALLTLMAGAMIPVGGSLALIDRMHPGWLDNEFRHFVIAFGGGALLAAIALVLVPEGSAKVSIVGAVVWFSLGSLAFLGLDVLLDRNGSSGSQLAATLSDFVPEALALGAAAASGQGSGLLLALLIGLQNLPEGFNSFREIRSAGMPSRKLLFWFFLLPVVGPFAGLAGYFWLADFPRVIGAIMLFASGGILYLVFQDIAPQAKLARHWSPPLGAVAGFLLGLVGQMLLA